MASEKSYIKLNVGGIPYTTSMKTLTRYPDSTLGKMFSEGTIQLAKDEHGRFFIDRDGGIFRYVLNFLRDGELILPDDFRQYSQLLTEAKFYQLTDLEDKMSFLLNVSGVHYKISQVTLLKNRGSWLEQTLNQMIVPLNKDPDGRYLIRRDGELFRYILNFMEDRQLRLPEKFTRFSELLQESQFYRLNFTPEFSVHLTVGGMNYVTTRMTLSKYPESTIGGWFCQTPIPLKNDAQGNYILEGDGEVFPIILSLMKGGSADALRKAPYDYGKGTGKKVMQELENYGLTDLRNDVERNFDRYNW